MLAEQNHEWTGARRDIGPEILAACRRKDTDETGVTIEAIGG